MTKLLASGIRTPFRIVAFLVFVANFGQAVANDRAIAEVAEACRQYLSASAAERQAIEPRIRSYRGPIEPIVELLQRNRGSRHGEQTQPTRFISPKLKERRRDDRLYFCVPDDYDPSKSWGLLVFMHGGSKTTPREFARHVVSDPETDRESYGLSPSFKRSSMIVVAPSAPWDESTNLRWNVADAEQYVVDVIEECQERFAIDDNRLFLGGYSMGGYGAFDLGQRLNDRLAGVVVFSGAWRTTRWEAWSGLPVFMRHGVHDAVPPGENDRPSRPRYTDVFYSRQAHKRLNVISEDNVYLEDAGGHSIRDADYAWPRLVEWMTDKTRNSYPQHVVAVSPRGWNTANDSPTPHSHWVTIHEVGDRAIDFDKVVVEGPYPGWKESKSEFDAQAFRVEDQPVRAGLIDATLAGKNTIDIRTENVERFSVWLHPSMVDFSLPVRLNVDGELQAYQVSANLLDALRSYERRMTWAQVHHAEIVVDVKHYIRTKD